MRRDEQRVVDDGKAELIPDTHLATAGGSKRASRHTHNYTTVPAAQISYLQVGVFVVGRVSLLVNAASRLEQVKVGAEDR